jgi:hypothetical protein
MIAKVDSASDDGQRERRLTVAQVRAGDAQVEVMFYETARIYRLLHDNPAYEDALRKLRAAMTEGTPVHVQFLAPNGDVIESVRTDV